MKNSKNIRSAAFTFWIIAIIVAVVTMPDLIKLGQEKGQVELPANLESEQAAKLLNDMDNNGNKTFQFALVFNDEEGISQKERQEINEVLNYFKTHKDEYKITNTFFYNESEQAENQLVSKDGTTIINQLTIEKGLESATDIVKQLNKQLDNLSIETYVTGSDVVVDDFSETSQEGVKKTEIIAIIFIIVILIIIFRSPIVPFVSLLTVGVSYLVSLSIIAQLVDHFNFPFSNFTQVFLVVILFGIGTDYNILLFTRFREELAVKGDILKAIAETYRTAGKTVLYSGIAVLFGMSALFFAQFSFYQATGGVAIGVAILLIVLFTLNPFFMGILGDKLFWPVKSIKSHNDNKLWTFLASQSFSRPIIGLILVTIIATPTILMYSGKLNFNDLTEINDKYKSKQAINLIADKFPAGMSSPTTLIIKSDDALTSTDALQALDQLTTRLKEIKGINQVYSVTRPEGKKINALYLNDQMDTLTKNLSKLENGTKTVREELEDATNQSAAATQQSTQQLPPTVAAQMQEELSQATGGLRRVEDGLQQTQDYTQQLADESNNTLYIPENILNSDDFKQSLNTYMDESRKMTKLTIILAENPYTAEAIEILKETQNVVHSYVAGSSVLHEADAYLGGKSMSNVDLQKMSNEDFKRSIIIILIGISIMLLFITRSLAQTIIILAALVIASFSSLGLTEWFTATFLNIDALSWNVPFFTYIMLITLGVDYSIFLMMRYKEFNGDQLSFIIDACKKMGGVILSAAIILGGTFAALIPSGINTLIQVAIAVMIGLVLLALLLMPIFIPSVFGIANLTNTKEKKKSNEQIKQ